MKRRKVYIVVYRSRATAYGIGTSQANLTECLKQTGIRFGIIELDALTDEISIDFNDGYEYISIPSPRSNGSNTSNTSKYYSRNVAYALRELITDNSDAGLIFHINFMTDATLVKYLKKLFRCKVVLTVHYTNWSFALLGDDRRLTEIMSKDNRRLNSFEKGIKKGLSEDIKMAQKCDRVVYIAEHSAKSMSKYMKANPHVIINNGLKDQYKKLSPKKKDLIRAKYFISPETKVIVFAGRLDEVKGVKYLIRAFRKILFDHPDTLLMIAGDGDFSSLLKEAEDIWSKIVFTGKIDKKKLYELYRIADIGVVSSLHEEFGNVVVEMMMHKLPVIVGDTGGPSEIVEEGLSGLKVPVVKRKGQRCIDVKCLASRIDLLLKDSDFAAKLGEDARKRFLEKYELSVFGEKMTTLYNNL